MPELTHNKVLTAAICFFLGLLVLLASRFYYAFWFLPAYHGSWSAALLRLIDTEGWWAYVSSPVGLCLHALALILILFAALLVTPPKRPSQHRGSP